MRILVRRIYFVSARPKVCRNWQHRQSLVGVPPLLISYLLSVPGLVRALELAPSCKESSDIFGPQISRGERGSNQGPEGVHADRGSAKAVLNLGPKILQQL